MSTGAIGIKIDIQGQQAQKTLDRLSGSFEKLEKALNKTQKSTKKTTQGMNTLSDQGIANIQAGLVQLSTYLLNLSVSIDNTFDKMLTRFKKVEDASNQLKTALGLPGMTGEERKRGLEDYAETEKLVKRLAATTQYTANEVYDALRNLTTAGFKPDEARKALAPVLKFVTAAGGQIGLAQGIEIARLSVQTMGEDINNLENSLNILAKGTSKTAIGFEDLEASMGGVGAGALTFKGEDPGKRLSTLFMIAAGQKAIGAEARGSGDMVRQFSNSIGGLVGQLIAYESKLESGGKTRYSAKRDMLFKMLGVDQKVDKKSLAKRLGKSVGKITPEELDFEKVQLAKAMLGDTNKEGKYVKKTASDLIQVFVDRFRTLEEIGGGLEAEAIFKTGFGVEAGSKIIKGLVQLMKNQGVDKMEELSGKIQNHNNIITKAQDESLKTLSARIKLAESAEDALSNTIFAEDSMYKGSLDTYTAVVTALNEIISSNKGLATGISATGRAFQAFTKVGTNMGFMLTAAATFSIALNHAQKATGKTITTLGGTLKAFHAQFLAPTLRVVLMFTGGIGLLTIAFLGLVKYLSDAETLGGGLASIFDSLKTKTQALAGMFRLAFSTKMEGGITSEISRYLDLQDKMRNLRLTNDIETKVSFDGEKLNIFELELKEQEFRDKIGPAADSALSLLNTKTIKGLTGFVSQVKKTFNTLSVVISSAMVPVSLVMGSVFEAMGYMFYVITFPINAVIRVLNFFGSEVNEVSATLETLGTVLGVVMAGFLLYKTVSMAAALVSTVYNGLFGTITRVAGATGRTNQVFEQLRFTKAKNISVSDQLRVRLAMLNATEERQARLVENLKNKYNNLNVAQQAIHNRTSGLNSKFNDMMNSGGEAVQNGFGAMQNKIDGVSGKLNKIAGVAGIASFGMMFLSDKVFGGNQTFSMLSDILLFVAGILPLLSAGFFSMAGAVLAALWPILAVVAAVGAAYAIFKAFSSDDKKKKKKDSYSSARSTTSETVSPNTAMSQTVSPMSPTSPMASSAYATPASSSAGVVNNNTKTSINRVEIKYVAKGHPLDKKEFDKFGKKIVATIENPRSNDNMGGVGR